MDTANLPLTSVILETKNAEFVARVNILLLDPMPDIVFWGSRYFIKSSDPDTYREGFGVAARSPAPSPEPALTYE